jgi:hypothetical protein
MFAKYARTLETASMAAMLLGIVFLCQPWSLFLHRYSILTIIVGLVAFNVFARIASPSTEPN